MTILPVSKSAFHESLVHLLEEAETVVAQSEVQGQLGVIFQSS